MSPLLYTRGRGFAAISRTHAHPGVSAAAPTRGIRTSCRAAAPTHETIPGWARALGVETQEDWAKVKSPQAKAFFGICGALVVGAIGFAQVAKKEYGVDLSRGSVVAPRIPGESLGEYQQRMKDTKEWRSTHAPPEKRQGETQADYTRRLNATWGQGKPDD